MIKDELSKIRTRVASLTQSAMQAPQEVRVKEYFPKENAVTVQLLNAFDISGAGSVPSGPGGDQKFALGYRGDVSESMSPQPGDRGLLFSTGLQYKKGFVLLYHTPGGEESAQYVPIRGGWGI